MGGSLMKITQLLTPMTDVHWILITDTVGDALDHMDTYDLSAAPILDRDGRYLGTVTRADLQRYMTGGDPTAALATPLSAVGRRSRNPAVSVDRDVDSLVTQAAGHRFIPVVDDRGRLLGIVDRRRVLAGQLPSAA
jgi:CBS domain-containing protein